MLTGEHARYPRTRSVLAPLPLTLNSYACLAGLDADAIIDVRSEAEFAEDRIPGAINLPALNNEERARVGTIYKQQGPFLARKVGAALVARNAAAHLEGPLAKMEGGWKPVVYCWRGGQRSGSFASILEQIGWRVDVIEGGYRSYRRLVSEMLYDAPFPAPVTLLDGNTGTAKTDLLHRVARLGGQVIDLEGLANHRGSLFGWQGEQPAQRGFETALARAVSQLDPTRPVLVEAESPKVGQLALPPTLLKAMRAATRIVIEAPLEARAAYLVRAYEDVASDRERLEAVIAKLQPMQPKDRIDRWLAMAKDGQLEPLAGELMGFHYDPRYSKMRSRHGGVAEVLSVDDLNDGSLDALAERIFKTMSWRACPEKM